MKGKAGVQFLYQFLYHFKTKAIKKRQKGHYITLKGLIQQEAITLTNIYAYNKEAPKYIKQILIEIKGKINSNTIVVGNFNTPLTSEELFQIEYQQGNSP